MENPFETILTEIRELRHQVEALKAKITAPPPAQEPESDLMTTRQAAKYMNVAKATIYRKASLQEIPYMKRNGRLYFDRAELKQYIKAGRVHTIEEIHRTALEDLIPPRRRK